MDPRQLKFARTHEWVSVEKDVATIGISDFAVRELTDVVHLELPEPGKKVRAGDAVGEIESVKAVSDLYAPLSGEIVEVNGELENDLTVLSDDPFGRGWMIRMRISDPAELSALLDFAAYELQNQSH